MRRVAATVGSDECLRSADGVVGNDRVNGGPGQGNANVDQDDRVRSAESLDAC